MQFSRAVCLVHIFPEIQPAIFPFLRRWQLTVTSSSHRQCHPQSHFPWHMPANVPLLWHASHSPNTHLSLRERRSSQKSKQHPHLLFAIVWVWPCTENLVTGMAISRLNGTFTSWGLCGKVLGPEVQPSGGIKVVIRGPQSVPRESTVFKRASLSQLLAYCLAM